MKDRIINLALYQAGWFAMVLGAAHKHPWKGSLAGLVLVLVHLWLARERVPEIQTVLAIGMLGTLVDSTQAFAGVFVFESGYWIDRVVPFWMTVMWMQFATLFHYTLSWLQKRYLLSAFMGGLGGPAAFLMGERLGGVIFPMDTIHSLVILSAVWAVVTPGCVWIAARFSPSTTAGRYRLGARN